MTMAAVPTSREANIATNLKAGERLELDAIVQGFGVMLMRAHEKAYAKMVARGLVRITRFKRRKHWMTVKATARGKRVHSYIQYLMSA